MGSEQSRVWPFAARLAARGAIAGGLVVVAAILGGSGKWISASLALALACAAAIDLVRVARRAERAMEDLVEQFAIGADDRPPRLDPAFRALDAAIERALAAMRAERASRAQRTGALEALLDTVPAALFVIDRHGNIVLANRPARRLAPTNGVDFARHGAFAEGDAAALITAPAGSKRLLRLTDGRSALTGVTLFTLADGSIRRLVSVQIVAEELSVVEANAWHHLARVLAHEMMNSLSPVISIAESLVGLLTQTGSELDRTEIAASLDLMARRANHLMNFVERYRAMLEMPEAILQSVRLAEFAADLARIAQANAVRTVVQVCVEPPDLTGEIDRELMEQALINLLKNAMEAVEATADPTIRIEMREEGDTLVLQVADNGPGLAVDPDILFLPFYTTKSNGSGIGLAIARQIAHAHGGSLAASVLDGGACFTLKLPIGPADRWGSTVSSCAINSSGQYRDGLGCRPVPITGFGDKLAFD